MHRFYPHQPDLNINNPLVRNEIHKVIGFWLELGLSGFRIDAVPFLIEQADPDNPAVRDPHDYLRDLHDFAVRRRGDAMLLAEANEPADKLAAFLGDRGNQMDMLFNFILNQALYLAFVRHDATPGDRCAAVAARHPGTGAMGELHQEPRRGQPRQADRWGTGGGVRRVRAEGLDAAVRPRASGAASRRWSAGTAGASSWRTASSSPCRAHRSSSTARRSASARTWPCATARRSARRWPGPTVRQLGSPRPTSRSCRVRRSATARSDTDGSTSRRSERDPGSLLNWMERTIRTRKEWPVLGWGEWRVLGTRNPSVLGHLATWQDTTAMAVHSFSAEPERVTVRLPESSSGQRWRHLLGPDGSEPPAVDGRTLTCELPPYGYHWFGARRSV